jgi:membrane dipeptidase
MDETQKGFGENRRDFLAMATAAAALIPTQVQSKTKAAAPEAVKWGNAIIVNALGGLDNPNVNDAVNRSIKYGRRVRRVLDARTLSDAHASGLTAVNCTLGYLFGEGDPYERTISDIANYDQMIAAQSKDLCKILMTADIVRAQRDGKIGLIYGFQNAAMVGDNLERIDVFADMGVRIIQLTYNPANQIGDGSMAPLNRGLTDFGREVVSRLNDNRIMVDLSHSGQKTCLEAARVSRQPISINHTGCRAVTESPRNKTDEELRLVAEKGGFVGIYFMPFLSPTMHVKGDDIVRHIEHAVQICGEDHVGIGTDGGVTQVDDLAAYTVKLSEEVEYRKKMGVAATGESADTFKSAMDMRGVNQFYDLAGRLEKRGFSARRIEKILGGNFIRYGREVWGA